jgi:predicted SAM-dependent methyltransferase
MRLNLGCSTDLRGGDWVNVDLVAPTQSTSRVPIATAKFERADLALPWPWEDSSVEEIYAADIFEHISDCVHVMPQECARCIPKGAYPYGSGRKERHWSGRIHVMNEAHRVLKLGGILTMECPDAAKGAGHFQDPTHVTPWTPNALQYYTDGSPAHKRFAEAYGITARFKMLGVTERMYTEFAGNSRSRYVVCDVWKFTAVLEAVKS